MDTASYLSRAIAKCKCTWQCMLPMPTLHSKFPVQMICGKPIGKYSQSVAVYSTENLRSIKQSSHSDHLLNRQWWKQRNAKEEKPMRRDIQSQSVLSDKITYMQRTQMSSGFRQTYGQTRVAVFRKNMESNQSGPERKVKTEGQSGYGRENGNQFGALWLQFGFGH